MVLYEKGHKALGATRPNSNLLLPCCKAADKLNLPEPRQREECEGRLTTGGESVRTATALICSDAPLSEPHSQHSLLGGGWGGAAKIQTSSQLLPAFWLMLSKVPSDSEKSSGSF